MLFINVLLYLVFEQSSWLYIVLSALALAGMWGMFRKSGVPSWWALIPWARDYKLAKCAGREPEGRVVSVTAFFISVANAIAMVTNDALVTSERISNLSLMLAVVSISLGIVEFIYMVRLYSGLAEVYNVKKRWVFLWLFATTRWIPALLWGYSPKYQPGWKVEEIRKDALSLFSGKEVAALGDGLTVNLQERSVTDFFQKKVLLRDIHMYIQPGHMVLLLGGSGAGKTTFLNAVNGYEKAKAKVSLNGGDIYAEYKKMQYEVGFVPQQELMRGKDTVLRTLMDSAAMRLPSDISPADRKARVEEVMGIFGLTPVKSSLVEKLSGGQKKRLSIAMEFISNPSLFILDEPDSGLDGVMARELMEQLRRIADQGKIVIVITHTPDRVIDLFDDVIVLAKDANRTGRLAYFGPIDEARAFFGKERMEQIVMSINRKEEGGEGRADDFIAKYAEVQHG